MIAGDFVHLKSLQVEEGAQAVITSENIKVLKQVDDNKSENNKLKISRSYNKLMTISLNITS